MAKESSQTLSLTSLLREALKIPTRNKRLRLSTILLGLLPLSLLVICHDLAVGPFLVELEDLLESELNDAVKARIKKDLIVLLAAESVFFVPFSLIFSYAITATTYSSAVVYKGSHFSSITLKEWFLRNIKIWKRPLITWLCIAFMAITYGSLVLVLLVSFSLITRGLALVAWFVVVGFLASLFSLYLANIWILGLVISILEDRCYGLKALGRAIELIQRKKVDGIVLLLLLVLLSAPIFLVFYLNTTEDHMGAVGHFILGTLVIVFICLVQLFTFVVYTVFYYECKNSQGEEVEMEVGIGYDMVSNVLHSDYSFP
eukprot:TRINITY_DN26694_c0_g1_i1.p1 TRINITY_DN26694_c0_g1~~TRINITY_DN26694_c0_g1_i1.p1  ORF type:complete len:316 (+),score=29.57 TRINITY_DN26694_c0_g1_i1:127-1074(+)